MGMITKPTASVTEGARTRAGRRGARETRTASAEQVKEREGEEEN
jgi:hypothetical protein